MAYRTLYFRRDDGSKVNRYFIFDTEAEMLSESLIIGDLAWALDTSIYFIAISETSWEAIGGAGAFVKIIGDTMTGPLIINPVSGNDALTLKAGKRLVFDGA